MLFNSLDFALFLPIVFVLYWFVTAKNLKLQNLLIVAASYVFYGWWDYRFLSLIIFSTVVDYLVGQALTKETKITRRKVFLWISICTNIGLLGFFKYYNFFQENFIEAFSFFGKQIEPNSLNIILPVGISFYTFQTLSYSIDVYRQKLEPTKDFIAFAAFVSFFPQLVAGPIERATNLLPQFFEKRKFEYAEALRGMRQILWGLFKKVVIADSCAEYASFIFDNSHEMSGSTLLLGAIFFAFQIYGDFSGYSDIAIGASRLFGFNLMQNFAFPYFSRDIAEFWRRWHISLSTWFRDYLYIPLGGSRGSTWIRVRNTFVIFIVSGFWHGPNWTFVVWGALNAVYFLPLLLTAKNRKNLDPISNNRLTPSLKEFFGIIGTFLLTVLAWVFFRAESIPHAMSYLAGIFETSLFSIPSFEGDEKSLLIGFLILVFVAMEWYSKHYEHGLGFISSIENKWIRRSIYLILVYIIAAFYMTTPQETFIYFQF